MCHHDGGGPKWGGGAGAAAAVAPQAPRRNAQHCGPPQAYCRRQGTAAVTPTPPAATARSAVRRRCDSHRRWRQDRIAANRTCGGNAGGGCHHTRAVAARLFLEPWGPHSGPQGSRNSRCVPSSRLTPGVNLERRNTRLESCGPKGPHELKVGRDAAKLPTKLVSPKLEFIVAPVGPLGLKSAAAQAAHRAKSAQRAAAKLRFRPKWAAIKAATGTRTQVTRSSHLVLVPGGGGNNSHQTRIGGNWSFRPPQVMHRVQ